MIRSVRYLSRKAAESMTFGSHQVVISITQPGGTPASLRGRPYELLRTELWDVITDTVLPGGLCIGPISERDSESIVAALQRWHALPNELELIAHCEGGLSRSAAVARFVAESFHVPIINGAADLANVAVLQALRRAAASGSDVQ